LDSMATVARKSGLSAKDMKDIFNTFTSDKDSLWIDRTSKTPYPLRKNAYIQLKKK
jgi:hypothetical protein